jgi:mannose-6-phosphate isomerase-like protein (cupin superfamily)
VPAAGDVIWNPLTGEKALLIESAEETGGARIVSDFAVEEGGFVPGGEHVHDVCSEHFDVQHCEIAFLVDGEERRLGPGAQLTVSPGSWHRWWNPGRGEVRIRTRIEPALRFEELIAILWGLCADGRTNGKGVPSPLYGALLATGYRREIRFRQPPALVQRLLLPPLAALARRRGLDRHLERYLDPATHPTAEAGRRSLPERVMRARG